MSQKSMMQLSILTLVQFYISRLLYVSLFFFFQAEDGIRDLTVTGVQTCALPISWRALRTRSATGSTSSARPGRGCCSSRACSVPWPSCAATWIGLLPRSPRRRSEERRVGEKGRSRWSPDHLKKKKKIIKKTKQ